jgi:hypothetical protein
LGPCGERESPAVFFWGNGGRTFITFTLRPCAALHSSARFSSRRNSLEFSKGLRGCVREGSTQVGALGVPKQGDARKGNALGDTDHLADFLATNGGEMGQ